jgi:hypothetical protein
MGIGWQMSYDANKAVSETKTGGYANTLRDEYAIRNW